MSTPEERERALRNVQGRLIGGQQRKTQLEPLYLKAREYVKTPEWQERRDQALWQIARIVNRVTSQKGADSNTFALALGQIIQVLEPLDSVVKPLVEYDSIQKSLTELGKLEENLKGD